MKMTGQRDIRPSSTQLRSLLYALVTAQGLSENSHDRWIQIKLTADTGACVSVMPKAGPCAHIKIHSSAYSAVGMSHEDANLETIPNLGE